MKLTQEADYAMRIILFLASKGMENRLDAKTISESEGISLRFTLKILRKLTQSKITVSFRGVNGGYSLAKSADKINLKEVIEAVEGPIFINRCLYDKSYCNVARTSTCKVHRYLGRVQHNLLKELESIDFKKILEGK